MFSSSRSEQFDSDIKTKQDSEFQLFFFILNLIMKNNVYFINIYSSILNVFSADWLCYIIQLVDIVARLCQPAVNQICTKLLFFSSNPVGQSVVLHSSPLCSLLTSSLSLIGCLPPSFFHPSFSPATATTM